MEAIIHKPMPDQTTNLAHDILTFLTSFVPYSVVFGIFWKIIDAVLKYASEGRDARTIELIKRETDPLANNIKDLTKSIWSLSEKIEHKK